jgi:tRNA (guanine-N7-)-methyltransferase
MKPGGIVHLKTDSMFLHQYSRSVAAANNLRVLACTEDLYSTPREELLAPVIPSASPVIPSASPVIPSASPVIPSAAKGSLSPSTVDALYEVQTFYEKMFLEQGYKITYLSFVIDHEGPYAHPSDFDEDYWRSIEGPRLLFGHDSAETRRQKLHGSSE